MSEASKNTYLTSSELFEMRFHRTLETVCKNLKYSRNYSFDYPQYYYKKLQEQRMLDEILNAEYLAAEKKGNVEYMKMYEKWKSQTLLDYVHPIGIHSNTGQIINTNNEEVDSKKFFEEGKATQPEFPMFLKEIYLDFMISAAFFYKFLKRMTQ